jgi:hypothetical protein
MKRDQLIDEVTGVIRELLPENTDLEPDDIRAVGDSVEEHCTGVAEDLEPDEDATS